MDSIQYFSWYFYPNRFFTWQIFLLKYEKCMHWLKLWVGTHAKNSVFSSIRRRVNNIIFKRNSTKIFVAVWFSFSNEPCFLLSRKAWVFYKVLFSSNSIQVSNFWSRSRNLHGGLWKSMAWTIHLDVLILSDFSLDKHSSLSTQKMQIS